MDLSDCEVDSSIHLFFYLESFEEVGEIRGSVLVRIVLSIVPFELLVFNLADTV